MPVAPFGGLNWQLQQGSNRSQIHQRKIFREECDNPVVAEFSQRGLPTWVVIVTAVVAPIFVWCTFHCGDRCGAVVGLGVAQRSKRRIHSGIHE